MQNPVGWIKEKVGDIGQGAVETATNPLNEAVNSLIDLIKDYFRNALHDILGFMIDMFSIFIILYLFCQIYQLIFNKKQVVNNFLISMVLFFAARIVRGR